DASRRREYAEALTRVYRKPGPWVYWGYRPPPRPANTVPWERTEAIAQSLDRVLADRDPAVRLAVLRRMQREKVPICLTTLGHWPRWQVSESIGRSCTDTQAEFTGSGGARRRHRGAG